MDFRIAAQSYRPEKILTVGVRLVGIDWSAVEAKRGLAVVDYAEGSPRVVELSACNSRRTAMRLIAEAVSDASTPSVIAIDAPLGWPIGMSPSLANHWAGEGLNVVADRMFSRDTDRFVQATLKKRPLEVGANLIARTAYSANQFLRDLRKETSRAIPLLWSPDELRDCGVIEVYPAATKIVAKPQTASGALGIEGTELTCSNGHVADAVWCAVAALHFVRGECHSPHDIVTSRREGWIWFQRNDVAAFTRTT
jgi:predicted nuclease with RNAse H fold